MFHLINLHLLRKRCRLRSGTIFLSMLEYQKMWLLNMLRCFMATVWPLTCWWIWTRYVLGEPMQRVTSLLALRERRGRSKFYCKANCIFTLCIEKSAGFRCFKANLESDAKNETGFSNLVTILLTFLLKIYICWKMRLWEFQNGKMGLYCSKIDWDRAKTVKRKILKNNSFH